MSTPHWVVCERSSRWAAALRVAHSYSSAQPANSAPLHEVRSLTELTDRLKTHPDSLVLIEITSEDFDAALTWLAAMTSRHKHGIAVALLDFPRMDNPVRPLFNKDEKDCPSYDRDIVATALREAGATDVIYSPRQIRPVLSLGERHASRCTVAASRRPIANESLESWAWSLLPWQEAGRPLG